MCNGTNKSPSFRWVWSKLINCHEIGTILIEHYVEITVGEMYVGLSPASDTGEKSLIMSSIYIYRTYGLFLFAIQSQLSSHYKNIA